MVSQSWHPVQHLDLVLVSNVFNDFSMSSTALSISFFFMINGGVSLMVVSWVGLASIPFFINSRQRSYAVKAVPFSNSKAQNNPLPLASLI